ncbi:hypothetical protein TIFTF001_016195 [Ficus carica]|uniref:Uncharacterized protein n=1 Tax=Ficus carica TaxID=3494 RepID=A0AA88A738_FICCA|nr:hypothetical protein TIFTF001_016195 [Ficus carica]
MGLLGKDESDRNWTRIGCRQSFLRREATTGIGLCNGRTIGLMATVVRSLSTSLRARGDLQCLTFFSRQCFFGEEATTVAVAVVVVMARRERGME